MEDKYSIFIKEYNKLETQLHKIPNAPIDANMKWYEDSITDPKLKNKLYYCRIVRNYIQHNDDYRNFIEISDGMINTVKEEYTKVFAKMIKAEDILTPIKKVQTKDSSDTAIDAISLISDKNLSFLPIVSNNTLSAIMTPLNALQSYSSCTKKTKISQLIEAKKINIPKELKVIKPEELLEDILNIFENTKKSKKPIDYILVTDTGNLKGKIIGIITKDNLNNIN